MVENSGSIGPFRFGQSTKIGNSHDSYAIANTDSATVPILRRQRIRRVLLHSALPGAAQFDDLDLQVLDLSASLTQLQIFRHRGGVMPDDEALEPLHIIRQCVDAEHGRIIRALLLLPYQRHSSVCHRYPGLAATSAEACHVSGNYATALPDATAPSWLQSKDHRAGGNRKDTAEIDGS